MKKALLVYIAVAILSFSCTETKPMEPIALYVGTFTDSDSEGIYRFAFDPSTGALTDKTVAATLPNPSFLKISDDNAYLYALQETDKNDGLEGAVSAFKIEKDALRFLNTVGTGGENPCHIGISKDGEQLAVSNYTAGNLALYTIDATGRLNKDKQMIDHKVLDTTKTSHVHMAEFMGNSVFTSDLGLDVVRKYVKKDGSYTPARQASLNVAEGAGPRHFVFSANAHFLYVLNELNSTLTVFEVDDLGTYNNIATSSTLAEDFKGESFCADIHLSPDGKFLYGSNRGENTIVIFMVDENTGKLTLVGRESVQGDWPRNFSLDPTGNFLLVANQKSNNITVFSRDVEKGTLTFIHETSLPRPVCLEFLK